MKLICVSGILGSGKTSLIRRLVDAAVAAGRTCALIVNENGAEQYPLDAYKAGGTAYSSLQGG
jgi:G3E family GTPase